MRDNEDAARAVGVDPTRVKVRAIAMSAALMGAAGAFYVQVFQYIDPGTTISLIKNHSSNSAEAKACPVRRATVTGPPTFPASGCPAARPEKVARSSKADISAVGLAT